MHRAWLPLLACCLSHLQLVGCEERKPYTPFSVEESSSPIVSSLQEELTPQPPSISKESRDATGLPSEWEVFGRKILAPEGLAFVTAIALPELTKVDLEDDSADAQAREKSQPGKLQPALFAWLASAHEIHSKPNKEATAGLWFFPQDKTQGQFIAPPEKSLPQGEQCSLRANFNRIGEETLALGVEATCQGRLVPGQPSQVLSIFQAKKSKTPLFELKRRTDFPGESISWEPKAIDQDQDGREDIQLEVLLEGPRGAEARTVFEWITRPAGASRNLEATTASLLQTSRALREAVKKKAKRQNALDNLGALRRLVHGVCAGSETERLLDGSGHAFKCNQQKAIHQHISYGLVDG
ncbi:MAG: hypothetical protein MK135_16815, partial [Polyangiaceae bacterium]|nr:hypothetical protein [Polyangiaceae bacterium]